jgi:HD-GYP domain-containing protein (c-di-GMP phosphodiesterase class II)
MEYKIKLMSEWPEGFDLNDKSPVTRAIKTFIESSLLALKEYDERRREWVKENLPGHYRTTYWFYEHSRRAAKNIHKTALHIGLSPRAAQNLHDAMLAHDFGKLQLPVDLWDMIDKPGDDIKKKRRRHTELGVQMVRDALPYEHPFIDLMVDIMLNHHEQMDGNGYRGIAGSQLSKPVRLASIVEAYDGWRTWRPHYGGRDITAAGVIERMRNEKAAAFFDMNLFEGFAEAMMKE